MSDETAPAERAAPAATDLGAIGAALADIPVVIADLFRDFQDLSTASSLANLTAVSADFLKSYNDLKDLAGKTRAAVQAIRGLTPSR